jgi:hypothetical protein
MSDALIYGIYGIAHVQKTVTFCSQSHVSAYLACVQDTQQEVNASLFRFVLKFDMPEMRLCRVLSSGI